MGVKTPPYENYPKWTQARFFGFLRSALRKAWSKYPPRFEAIRRAEVGKMINRKTGREAMHHKCVKCNGLFPAKEIQVDHKIDAGQLKKFEDIEGFCRRLFCSVDELQVMCKACHKEETDSKRENNKQKTAGNDLLSFL